MSFVFQRFKGVIAGLGLSHSVVRKMLSDLNQWVPSHLAEAVVMMYPANAIRTHTCEMTVGIADSSSVFDHRRLLVTCLSLSLSFSLRGSSLFILFSVISPIISQNKTLLLVACG